MSQDIPAMKSSKNQATTGQVASALITVAVIIAASGFAWYWMQKQAGVPEKSPSEQSGAESAAQPTPTPTPTKLFHGKDTYIVSRGSLAKRPEYFGNYIRSAGSRSRSHTNHLGKSCT